jgi:predicted Zn-dependent protease
MNVADLPRFFDASLFDGQTALAQPVRIAVSQGQLVVFSTDGVLRERAAITQAKFSEPTRYGPRFVELSNGITLEVHNADDFNATVGEAGQAPPLVARLQHRWPIAIAALALLVALGVYAYIDGLPALARWTAFHLPDSVETRIGAGVLAQFDARVLEASELAEDRRRELSDRFAKYTRTVAPGVSIRLEFRRRNGMSGINAFALPGGTIVLLDGLVDRAEDDEQILAVLGHELGHVVNKHSMRQLMQTVGVGLMAGAIWGDFSSVAANVPVVLGALSYSRDFEREADDFARDYLLANGSSPEALASFFDVLTSIRPYRGDGPDFLSSHPPTQERIDRLRDPQGNR